MTFRQLARAGRSTLAALSLPLFAQAAIAAGSGDHSHGHGHGGQIGEPGEASKASRTIEVVMYDNYYEPETISVAPGNRETILIVVPVLDGQPLASAATNRRRHHLLATEKNSGVERIADEQHAIERNRKYVAFDKSR